MVLSLVFFIFFIKVCFLMVFIIGSNMIYVFFWLVLSVCVSGRMIVSLRSLLWRSCVDVWKICGIVVFLFFCVLSIVVIYWKFIGLMSGVWRIIDVQRNKDELKRFVVWRSSVMVMKGIIYLRLFIIFSYILFLFICF